MNLATIIDEHPDDACALISRGKPTDYATLRRQVAGLRTGLIGLGLEPGDRVAIVSGNNRYFVVSYLAALSAGLVVVPLNPTNPQVAVAHELTTVGARAVIVGPAGRAALAGVDPADLPMVEFVIGAGFTPEGGLSFEELSAEMGAPVVERNPDDLAVLIFTSGTAGLPRAAMLTHGNLYANIRQMLASADGDQQPDDVVFGVLPMFHIFGLNVVLGASLFVGSAVLLIERFDPVSALESIQKWGATIVSGPPTMWAAWAGVPGVDPDIMSSVRLAVSGAAKLPVEVAQAIEAKYGLTLEEGYGLTEASPVVTSPRGIDAPAGSIGIPVPGMDLRIVDAQGDDVLVGDAGEIWVRGPNVFAGYWDAPEATASVLTEDGWLRTGDVAVVDDDGFIFLVDRAKDLIIVSGFNVFPAEVEAVLAEHPAVEASAVVGVPHPYTGEAVKAYVKARAGVPVEEDDVIAFCAERLPGYKCPSKVWFVDDIPRGITGKILRFELKKAEAG
ncbi:MAG: long-chain-fatty-acid--CoA ligase [Microthrixaceae bacterium]